MGGGAAIIIWILVFFGIFYFLAIRPQRRQKQQHSADGADAEAWRRGRHHRGHVRHRHQDR